MRSRAEAEERFRVEEEARQFQTFEIFRQALRPASLNPKLEAARAILQQYPSTGSWFLNMDLVKRWLGVDDSSICVLRLSGIPGAGMSLLRAVQLTYRQIYIVSHGRRNSAGFYHRPPGSFGISELPRGTE